MIGAIDVYYKKGWANAALLGFQDWESESKLIQRTNVTNVPDQYIPGEFYKKELPVILELLSKLDTSLLELLIVDSYVFLDDKMRPGMGHYLWEALDQKIPIIGVAKNKFKTINKVALPILRGKSSKPLFITAVGLEPFEAANRIRNMKGAYRIPDLLKAVDTLSRSF